MNVLRMCCVCRGKKSPIEMIRVVRTPQGEILVDRTGRKDGRGCYVCRSLACIEKGIKGRFVNRAFRCEVPQEVYQEVKKEYDGEQ